MKIKALIVDDEAPSRSEMRYLLNKINEVEVLGEATTADEAMQLMESVKYDVVLLDINMPGVSGLEMVEKIKQLNYEPSVIFITAYGQFAVKAFELEAVDYLLKPISEERLRKAISKVKRHLKKGGESSDLKKKRATLERIPVTKQSKTILINPDEIYFIESQGEFTLIHSTKGEFLSSFRLKEFESRLPEKSFFRSHRSYVVNLDQTTEMISLYGGLCLLKMKDPQHSEVPVSRRQARKLKTLLGIRK